MRRPQSRIAQPHGPGCYTKVGCPAGKFGQGIIVAAEGRGSDARVQVNFGAAGSKWLALAYAKLTPAG